MSISHLATVNKHKLYTNETRQGRLFGVFALLAVLVSCLGLFGLASFTAEQRTKEIGIRKTLGASIPRIMLLLPADFSKAVLAPNLIAWLTVAFQTLRSARTNPVEALRFE